MKLVKSLDILLQYLPNTFATVEGEANQFDKLSPFLAAAENWFVEHLAAEKTFNTIAGYSDENPVKVLAIKIVVEHAFADAIPSLDLVLTPNGFGIVSNQNVVPASADRVNRLIASLRTARDSHIEAILPLLVTASGWQSSSFFGFYSATLFPNISLSRLAGSKDAIFDSYLRHRQQVLLIEDMLAERFISQELYSVLRRNNILGTLSAPQQAIVSLLQSVELDMLAGKPLNEPLMASLVERIRTNPSAFPEWQSSTTAQLFQQKRFENQKKSGGYWW